MSSFELILVTWIVQISCQLPCNLLHLWFRWLQQTFYLTSQVLLQPWYFSHQSIIFIATLLAPKTLKKRRHISSIKNWDWNRTAGLQHSWLTSHTNKNYLFCEYNWTLITFFFFFFLQLSGFPSLLPLFLWILISQCRCTYTMLILFH